ncbi:Arogenate dehydratase 4, chloroplastic [Zea mays]|uniref:Arogenate dehydratase 4, chloroplastic n=1 Tax=Zea mays TaxID=4577 RepID=A0A3L6E9H4_MAIZE|nr:Arogenate dehydratase 4, chloroplastic [Zea mays]
MHGSQLRMAYQGVPGAYSEAAAAKAYPGCDAIPCDQFKVQDNNLLSSETCVHFLLKLLNPQVNVVDAKAPSIEDILLKVEEILLSCKEIKPADRDYKRTTRPELCSKWLALLTMEKACLSVVALEDTSDMVLELGGNFKETLRQLGGLDDIFNVMVNCHSELEYTWSCNLMNIILSNMKNMLQDKDMLQ